MDPTATWQMLCDYLRALYQDPHDEELRANAIELLRALVVFQKWRWRLLWL